MIACMKIPGIWQRLIDYAIATGTPEVGGWTTRELLTILDGLEGLEVVGADVGKFIVSLICVSTCRLNRRSNFSIVEVSPIYDNPGETTTLAASEVAVALISLMVNQPIKP
jgi:agmatinase